MQLTTENSERSEVRGQRSERERERELLIEGLTVLKVIGLAQENTNESHELELGEPLPRGRRQRQQVPQVRDLGVDQVPSQFARTFR